jgi:hypothetical protein
MTVRALPTASYPVLVCEAAIPDGATRAQLVVPATGASWELPLHSQSERVYVVCLTIVAGCVREPCIMRMASWRLQFQLPEVLNRTCCGRFPPVCTAKSSQTGMHVFTYTMHCAQVGDTGCRLDETHAPQACRNTSDWAFGQVAQSIAAGGLRPQ